MKKTIKKVRRGLSRIRSGIKSHLYTVYFLQRKGIHEKYYVCSRGIGDTEIFLSRLKSYYEQYGKKVNLIIAKNQEVLINPYRNYIDKIIVLKTSQVKLLTRAIWANKIYKNKLEFILPAHAADLLNAGDNLFDLTGKTLGIDGDDFEAPEFGYLDTDSIFSDNLQQLRHDKYVFFAPDSVSVSVIENNIWKEIADICRYHGFLVVENGNKGEKDRLGDVEVFKTIDETYLVAQKADLIISARSGLSDLLAFAGKPMIVVYPDQESLQEFTFSRMPFSKHVKELIANDALKEKVEELICL